MEASPVERLLEAFRMFDAEGNGTIPEELMAKLMIEEGEPFTEVR